MLVGSAAGFGIASRYSDPPRSASFPAAPGIEASSSATIGQSLRAHEGPLRSSSPKITSRRPATTPKQDADAVRADLPRREAEAILQELLALVSSGWKCPTDSLVRRLVQGHLEQGDPQAAFLAVQRFAPDSDALFNIVGLGFLKSGDESAARLAYRTAVELNPIDQHYVGALQLLDPELAAELMRNALASDQAQGCAGLEANLAGALRAMGDVDGALAAIRRGLELSASPRLMKLLAELDPLDAELRLREKVEDGGRSRDYQELASLIAEQGRREEAALLLQRGLESQMPSKNLLQALVELDASRAYDHLVATAPDDRLDQSAANRWSKLAYALLNQEDRERAADAWCRAILAAEYDPGGYVDSLREHAPKRLIPVLERRVQLREHDEFLGSLGDAYWRADRYEEAANAWARALALDPGDDEWRAKVAAVRDGRDPLAGY